LAPHWQAIDDAPWDVGGYPITIFRSIPPKHRPAIRGIEQAVLNLIEDCNEALAWKLHFLLPTMLLDPRSNACDLTTANRLAACSELRWGELLLHLATPIQSKRVPENATLKKERKEERAAQLVGKGQISRAYTALTSSLSPEVY